MLLDERGGHKDNCKQYCRWTAFSHLRPLQSPTSASANPNGHASEEQSVWTPQRTWWLQTQRLWWTGKVWSPDFINHLHSFYWFRELLHRSRVLFPERLFLDIAYNGRPRLMHKVNSSKFQILTPLKQEASKEVVNVSETFPWFAFACRLQWKRRRSKSGRNEESGEYLLVDLLRIVKHHKKC